MPTTLKWIDKFYQDWRPLSVLDALDVIIGGLECANAMFRRGSEELPLTDLYNESDLFALPAKSLYIEWYGGPPGLAGWFRASLLCYAVDRCLYAQAKGWAAQVCNAIKMAERYGCYEVQSEQVGSE